jgi:predicted permease
MLFNLWGDLRLAARSLSRRPGFAAVVMLTLALGIGVNVAIFSLFQQILTRPLPVLEPERLVNLTDPGPDYASRSNNRSGNLHSVFSYPMFRDLERGQESFVGIAAHRIFDASLSTGEQAWQDSGILVSGSYFPVLGLQPSLGRLLEPQDDRVDGLAQSVVLSHAYWQREFGADPNVVGRRLIVNGTPLTIVGVGPRGFHGTTAGVRARVFVPITFRWLDVSGALPNHDDRNRHWAYLFARLREDATREEAAAAVNVHYRAILNEIEAPLLTDVDEQALEEFRTKPLVLEPGARGQSAWLASVREQLAILFAVSGAVLLLCCANLAGLFLIKGSARSGEMAVRASMGATRRRLASHLLSESLLLALPAGIASLPVAWLTLRLVGGMPGIPWSAFEVDLNVEAALAAIGIAIVSALAFSLFPVWELVRRDPNRTIKAYGGRQTTGKRITHFRGALATAQIALAMGLLAMVGAFAQSLANIARIDLGLDVDSVATFSVAPETSGYSPEASARLFDRLEEELAAIPGVTSTASSSVPLLSNSSSGTRAVAEDADRRVEGHTYWNDISPGFFRTLDIALLAGRDFNRTDAADAPAVVIVNQRFAERFGLGRDVIGRHITVGGIDVQIVGLASDSKYNSVRAEIEPQTFRPRRQSSGLGAVTFYIRGARPPQDLMDAVRETVARVDPIVPLAGLRTMQQQVRENLATERFLAGTSSAFAVLATVLAGLGLYGVLAYSVARRSREIGLRVALGAAPGRIRAMVLQRAAVMALAGIALGIVAAWLLGRAVRSLLFGVEAGDPVALAAAATVLAVVTLGSAYLPARRASRVDPMTVLRYE